MKNLVFGVGGNTHGVENTRSTGMELDESEVEFDMGKLFLLGDDCVDHVVQCRMDEIHLGVLLGLLVLVLAGLVMSCIFSHGTGTIDGTIHDDTDFLPGLEGGERGSVSKRGNIDLDNPAVEWGQGFGAGRRSLIGGELDGSLHIDCFLLVVYG